MAVTEYDGVVINNLTLAKYKELKSANQKVASQTYVITDLDEHLHEYWEVREGVVVPVDGLLFYNPNTVDLSSLPLNVTLVTLTGQNGTIVNLSLVLSSGTYKLQAVVVSNGYTQVLASGNSLSSINFSGEYMRVVSTSYGYFLKVTYIHSSVLSIIDNLLRINNFNF